MEFLQKVKKQAGELLEKVDKKAAEKAEDSRDSTRVQSIQARKQAEEATKRIESRSKYVSRFRNILSESTANQRSSMDGSDNADNDEQEYENEEEHNDQHEQEIENENNISNEEFDENENEKIKPNQRRSISPKMMTPPPTTSSSVAIATGEITNSEATSQSSEHDIENKINNDQTEEQILSETSLVESVEQAKKVQKNEDDIQQQQQQQPVISAPKREKTKPQGAKKSKKDEDDGYTKVKIKDLEDMDAELVRMQQDLDSARDALTSSQSVAAEREGMLKEQIRTQRNEFNKREEDLKMAVEVLQKRVTELENELSQMNSEEDDYDSMLQKSKQEIEDLKTQLQVAKISSEEAILARDSTIAALEKELRNVHKSLEDTRLEHVNILRKYEKRATDLEDMNAEISRELAKMQRHLEFQKDGGADIDATLSANEDELNRAIENLRMAELSLEQERAKLFQLMRENESSKNEIQVLRKRAEEWEAKYHQEIKIRQDEYREMSHQLEELRNSKKENGVEALEKRLSALSEHLVQKQHQIEVLTSEKRALQQRLQQLEISFAEREQMLLQDRGNAGEGLYSYGNDIERGSDIRYRSSSVAKRRGENAPRIAKLEQIAKFRQVAQAVDVVDKFSLTLGSVLYYNPWFRLGFVCYILLLHIWVFFVIQFHTREIHEQGSIPVVGMSAIGIHNVNPSN